MQSLAFLGFSISVGALAIACGARSNLDPGREGTGGTSSGPGTSSTVSTTTGQGGQGGEEPVCERLAFVGEPFAIGVSAATPASRPRLVALSEDDVALTFELAFGAGNGEIFSVALEDPFDNWPPTQGSTPTAHFPVVAPIEVAAGDVGEVAFTTIDPLLGNSVIGGFSPGDNGSSFLTLPVFSPPLFLTAAGSGTYLAGLGGPNNIGLYWVGAFAPEPLVNDLGAIGCAEAAIEAEAVLDDDGDFWVAGLSDMPLDDCIDPDVPGPARFASLWRATATERNGVAAMESMDTLSELDLAADGDAVWIGYGGSSQAGFTLWQHRNGADVTLSLGAGAGGASHDLGAVGNRAILVQLLPGVLGAGGELRIMLVGAEGVASELVVGPSGSTSSEPTILVRDDQALVAWADAGGSLLVVRADCVEP